MSYAFFTILPGSTKFPAHSVDVYSPAPAKCMPEALLIATGFCSFPSGICNIPKFKRNPCPSLPGRRLPLLHLPLTDLFLSNSPCVFELGIVAEP
jgi:hypothetical protein